MGRSFNEMNSGASAAKVTPERLDPSGVLLPSAPNAKARTPKSTEPILSEEDLAPSRKAFVQKGGQLPSTGVSTRQTRVTAPKTRGVVVSPTIKTNEASVALQGLHTHLSTHLNELSSHQDHDQKTLSSLEIAKGHLDQARAAISKGNKLKSPQEIDGKRYTFTADAHKSYQQASRHLTEAHRQLSAGHVRDAADSRSVASGLPEQEHVADLHKRVHTLNVLKSSKPFKKMEFGGTTITGSAISELGQLAKEKDAPEPVRQKITRAVKGTPRVSKRERLQGARQQQLTKGDYTNPQRKASPTAGITGRGPMAQRKPGRTPGFEG